MGMNRRNVLVGLGGLTVGGGALFASGAFTTVEAQRTVSVETAGDSAALLSFQVNAADFNGVESGESSDGVVRIDLTEINREATTTFEGVLTVENNGSNPVELSIAGGDDTISFLDGGEDISETPVSLDADGGDDDSVDLDLAVEIGEGEDDDGDVTLTFVAEDNS